MKMYFLSSRPCILTVNDAYFGICDNFERFAEVVLTDRLFIRFIPENAQPIGFFLTEDIRFTPPDGVDVYLVKDGIALYAHSFAPLDNTLRPVSQVKTDGRVATLFFQGELHLSLQSDEGLFVATLPPTFADCEITFIGGVFLLKTATQVAIFNKKAERLLMESMRVCKVEDEKLYLEIPLCDRLGRTAESVYDLQNGCTRERFTLKQTRTQNGETEQEKIRDELLAYAFFESVLIDAEYTHFLSNELQPKAEDLRAFLGDFIDVTLTNNPYVCGLIRKKQERLFQVAYFSVKVENGKICDIVTA